MQTLPPLPKPTKQKPPKITLGGQQVSPKPDQIPHDAKPMQEQQKALANLQKLFEEIRQKEDGWQRS